VRISGDNNANALGVARRIAAGDIEGWSATPAGGATDTAPITFRYSVGAGAEGTATLTLPSNIVHSLTSATPGDAALTHGVRIMYTPGPGAGAARATGVWSVVIPD